MKEAASADLDPVALAVARALWFLREELQVGFLSRMALAAHLLGPLEALADLDPVGPGASAVAAALVADLVKAAASAAAVALAALLLLTRLPIRLLRALLADAIIIAAKTKIARNAAGTTTGPKLDSSRNEMKQKGLVRLAPGLFIFVASACELMSNLAAWDRVRNTSVFSALVLFDGILC